jgi:hypothetical protein
VSVELVDVRDGARLWGQRHSFPPAELPSMQPRIASDVASVLAVALDARYALACAGLADVHGLLGFENEPPGEQMVQARARALKAIELDPNLAEGYFSLAMVKAL